MPRGGPARLPSGWIGSLLAPLALFYLGERLLQGGESLGFFMLAFLDHREELAERDLKLTQECVVEG